MKRKSTVFIVVLLFLAGLCVMLYPTASNWLAERNSTRAITQYVEQTARLEDDFKQAELARARAYNADLVGYSIRDPFNPEEEFEIPADYLGILNVDGVIGYLEIAKIDVKLPIKHGVSEEVLQRNVGHMQSTAFPVGGESTHAVLTGHRGLPSAKLFTDLDKLAEGDYFLIHVMDEILCYEVDQIVVVEPYETDELLPVGGMDYVTLITCTPYGINSHRMFVRGHRVPYTEEIQAFIDQQAPVDYTLYIFIAVGAGMVLVTIIIVTATSRQRRPRKHVKRPPPKSPPAKKQNSSPKPPGEDKYVYKK